MRKFCQSCGKYFETRASLTICPHLEAPATSTITWRPNSRGPTTKNNPGRLGDSFQN